MTAQSSINSKSQTFEVNEKTTIPLLTVIAAVPIIFGLVMWISFIAYTSNANADHVIEIKSQVDIVSDKIVTQNQIVIDRLGRIEEQLKYIQKHRN